jgi:hypothetical protein
MEPSSRCADRIPAHKRMNRIISDIILLGIKFMLFPTDRKVAVIK